MYKRQKLINDSNGEGKLTQHIVSAKHVVGSMVNSSLDTDAQSANGLVDDSYESYYRLEDWDDAVSYHPVSYTHLDVYKRQDLNHYISANKKTAQHDLKTQLPELHAVESQATYLLWIDVYKRQGYKILNRDEILQIFKESM